MANAVRNVGQRAADRRGGRTVSGTRKANIGAARGGPVKRRRKLRTAKIANRPDCGFAYRTSYAEVIIYIRRANVRIISFEIIGYHAASIRCNIVSYMCAHG